MNIEPNVRVFYYNRKTKKYSPNTANTIEFALTHGLGYKNATINILSPHKHLVYKNNKPTNWELHVGKIAYGPNRTTKIELNGAIIDWEP